MNLKKNILLSASLVALLLLSACDQNPQNNNTQDTNTVTNKKAVANKEVAPEKRNMSISSVMLITDQMKRNGRIKASAKLFKSLLENKKDLPLEVLNKALMSFIYAGNPTATLSTAQAILKKDPHNLNAVLAIITLMSSNRNPDPQKVLKSQLNACNIAKSYSYTPAKYKKEMFKSSAQLQKYMYKSTIDYIHGWCMYEFESSKKASDYFQTLAATGPLFSSANLYKGIINSLENQPKQAELNFAKNHDQRLNETLQIRLWQGKFAHIQGNKKMEDVALETKAKVLVPIYSEWRTLAKDKSRQQLFKDIPTTKQKPTLPQILNMVYIHQATILKTINFNYYSNILLQQASWIEQHNCLQSLLFAQNLSTNPNNYQLQQFIFKQIPEDSYCSYNGKISAIQSAYSNNKNDAKILIDKLLTEDPNRRNIREVQASVFFFTHEYQKSIDAYDFLLNNPALQKVSPITDARKSFYLFSMAAAYERKDKTNTATYIKHLRESIKLNPKNDLALNFLGYTLIDNSLDIKEGIAQVEQALKLSKNNPYYMDSLAWGYFKEGKFQQAIDLLEKARLLDPNQPELLSHLGEAYYGLGQMNTARLYWKRSLLELNDTPKERLLDYSVSVEYVQKQIEKTLE